jgi:hypothetical protein
VVNPKRAATTKSIWLLMEAMTQKVQVLILRNLVPDKGRRQGALTSTRRRLRRKTMRKELSMLVMMWTLKMLNRNR